MGNWKRVEWIYLKNIVEIWKDKKYERYVDDKLRGVSVCLGKKEID